MKKFNFFLLILIISVFVPASLFGCGDEEPSPDEPSGEESVVISLSCEDFFIFFGEIKDGKITIGGREYSTGELLPVFSELSELLSVDFCESDGEADIVFGDAASLAREGVYGNFLNLSEYLDLMPNFSAFLNENPLIRLSVSSDEHGAFFVIPYLAENSLAAPLFNADLLRALLDGEGEFTSEVTAYISDFTYTPIMPSCGMECVKIIRGGEVSELTKNYDAGGNIIEFMNYEISSGKLSAVDAVNMIRRYIDDTYSGFYGVNRSELFLGESAAWDADELVALLRCAVALGGEYGGLFVADATSLVKLAGMLFSAPGLLYSDYLYLDSEGYLRDARGDIESYEAILLMQAIIGEGLITDSPDGIFSYGCGDLSDSFSMAMPPISVCDGDYVRMVDIGPEILNLAAAVNASVAEDEEKLSAVLNFIDYLFSDDGLKLVCYGTEELFDVVGDEILPTEAALSAAEEYTGGNLSEFMREYVGAGVLFPCGFSKSDSGDGGKSPLINKAIEHGLIRTVGVFTDDGICLSPTSVRMYTKEEYELCDSNSYRNESDLIFEEILLGERKVNNLSDVQNLVNEIFADSSRSDYISLKQNEMERRLRCYKIIAK